MTNTMNNDEEGRLSPDRKSLGVSSAVVLALLIMRAWPRFGVGDKQSLCALAETLDGKPSRAFHN